MGKTTISIEGDRFFINQKLVYSELAGCPERVAGLLFNQRVIQGIFDDPPNRARYRNSRMAVFEPDRNTDNLIHSLPAWYQAGLRAITVGLQGGWPVGFVDVREIEHNPFGVDGESMDPAFLTRLERVILAADGLGMVVIVNIFYWAQAKKMRDGTALRKAATQVARWVKDKGFTNILFDVANEFNIDLFADHPLINTGEGISSLIDWVRTESGGVPTAASGGGGMMDMETARRSDFLLVHGNGLTKGQYSQFIALWKQRFPNKPLLCNEDSPCITRLDVAVRHSTSWGYYNNYTKQIPPADFGITAGEDTFFARKMQKCLGMALSPLALDEQYVLQGATKEEQYGDGFYCVRIAAEEPDAIERVEYSLNGAFYDVSYDEPFFCKTDTTWLGENLTLSDGSHLVAQIFLRNGQTIDKNMIIGG